MPTTITIDPVTRIEGHLKVEITVDDVYGSNVVVDAKSSGTMFRGFEAILQGRSPLDAPHITQRICGVCPIAHGMAASLNLENAFGVQPPANGRILRNLVLGANFIQSHILHFYHLAALDYINTEGILDLGPWMPRYATPDMVTGSVAAGLVNNYVAALAMRRKSHQMGAIFGGKMPCSPTLTPGGCSEIATAEKIADFRALLSELRSFVDGTMIPDVLAVADVFPEYYSIGEGCGNLIAYGVFDQDNSDANKLLKRGIYSGGLVEGLDPALIKEYVASSYYQSGTGLNPAVGETVPDVHKSGAYSWLKSPRYQNDVYEAGPLSRMMVNGDYTRGISVLDRIAARALETKKVADAMDSWLDELAVGDASYEEALPPNSGTGMGLTEAPRGALGHWIDIDGGNIARYQVVSPTNWNASPADDMGQKGPIEQALIGTPIGDLTQPIEALRVVHSFDPCLACSVHMMRPGKKEPVAVVDTQTG